MNHQHFMRPFLKRALAWAFAESKRRQVKRGSCIEDHTTRSLGLTFLSLQAVAESSGKEKDAEQQAAAQL